MVMKVEIREFEKREKFLQELEYEFTRKLIELRKGKKLSQEKLAKQAHVIRETIARIEANMVSPNINTIIKMLEPLGYTINISKIKERK